MKNRTKLIILVVILSVAAYIGYNSTKQTPLNYTGAKVERGDVVQTVSATGTVEAAKKIDLKFMSSEKIKEINVKVGDEVKEGDILAKLDTSKLDSQLLQAQASLVAAQANLQTVLNGST
ncbi:MAG: biotin/lipoyl-binding protein, partial [Candidatus Paceibacterota bacterium]